MERKIIKALISTIPLMLLWHLVYEKNIWAVELWASVGVDITRKYHFFILLPHEHPQYLKWYVHYTAYYYTLIVLAWCLLQVARRYFTRPSIIIIKTFYYFSIFRLLEYWLFRFHLGFSAIVFGILIFSLFARKWQT